MLTLKIPEYEVGTQMAESTIEKQAQELRQAFDRGRESGLQLKQEHSGPIGTRELAQVLSRSALPCVGGSWQEREPDVWVLQRTPCQRENPHMCAVWRESVDGLVMGAGEDARYSRHSHYQDPGELCVDVLYTVEQPHWRWAALPEIYQPLIQQLQTDLAKHHAEIKILGYAEGQVFYTLKDTHPSLAGHRVGFLSESVQQKAKASAPQLEMIEMSPRAVWNGD